MVCSDEFGPLGRAEAEVLGAPGLPLVPIPHPLADNEPHLVEAKATVIVDEVISALTGDAATVAAAHRERFRRLTQRRLEAGELCLDDACAIDLALPSDALPSGGLSSDARPSGGLPSDALPSGALPSGALPSDAQPSDALPSGGQSSDELPSRA